jgi:hypothetical protein
MHGRSNKLLLVLVLDTMLLVEEYQRIEATASFVAAC